MEIEEIKKIVMKSIEESRDGVLISIYVKTESEKEELRLENSDLVYYTTEPDLHGRANSSLVRFFTRTLGVPVTKIDIVYGVREKLKKILVKDIDSDTIVSKIAEYISMSMKKQE